MTHHHGHGGAFGAFALVAAITFAFGAPVARFVVGSVLILAGLAFAYIAYRIVMGTI